MHVVLVAGTSAGSSDGYEEEEVKKTGNVYVRAVAKHASLSSTVPRDKCAAVVINGYR